MSSEEKRTNLRVSRRRYVQLTNKKEKGLFLDPFCCLTGLDRKHAIQQLRRRKNSVRRGHPRRYDMASRELLTEIWILSNQLFGKLLHAVVAQWLTSIKARGHVDPAAEKQVLAMSASAMDRLCCQVPLKVDVWPEYTPCEAGWIEADTVAHCGKSTAGNFVWSLVLTDVATQWTEIRCVRNKGTEGVCRRVIEIFAMIPFIIKAMNSDNGSEFLNDHMARQFPGFCPAALRTRSRPYRKNDHAHGKQKNGHRMRRLFGYERFEDAEPVEILNKIAIHPSRFDNPYSPAQSFENPSKTPAMRIPADPPSAEKYKIQVRQMLARNDPITPPDTIHGKMRKFQNQPDHFKKREEIRNLIRSHRKKTEKTFRLILTIIFSVVSVVIFFPARRMRPPFLLQGIQG